MAQTLASSPSTCVVGGGIIGLATAYRLSQRFPGAEITVLEKESEVGRHQTGNNSGVLHAGLYYKPGSFKAKLAVSGIREMVRFCEENSIAHEICGKLVIAFDQEEIPRLEELYRRGTANGLQGLKLLGPEEIREIEPHAAGLKAIRVPQEGIVDYKAVCRALVAKLREAGAQVVTGARVTRLVHDGPSAGSGGQWIATTASGDEYRAQRLINCAGLHCDRVARLAGERPRAKIVPFRGEYYMIRPERQHLVRHLIYPVPDPAFPFLGVHFTRMIGGGVEAGPNAVLAFAREGYTKSRISPRDLADALGFPGLWRFLRKYPSIAWHEVARSFSRELFCKSLQRLVPEIRPEDLQPGGAGVRAQAMLPDGTLLQDFEIVAGRSAVHVLNAPSPGATASLAIGDAIVDQVMLGESQ